MRWLEVMPLLLHLSPEFNHDLLGEFACPGLHVTHALIQDRWLLGDDFLAERRFVERKRIPKLLLGEARGVKPGRIVYEFRGARSQLGAQFCGDLVQLPTEHDVGLQEGAFGPLDQIGDHRVIHRCRAFRDDDVPGERDRIR